MAQESSSRLTRAATRVVPRLHIPPRWHPFLRLAAVAAIVLVIDEVTGRLTERGGAVDPWIVTAARIASSLLVLRFPLAGFVFALEVDKWDWYWLDAGSRSEQDQALYQRWDKGMDLVTLGAAAFVTWRWRDRVARTFALGMFGWRAIGTVAFVATGQSWLLIAFPNVFESLYLLYMIFVVLSGQTQMLNTRRTAVLVSLAVIVPKVAEEFFLHAFDNRPWTMFDFPLPGPISEAVIWGAAMYALPLLALVVLVSRAHGHPTRGDPEEQVSAV
jgi:hypothetical protein